MAVPVEYVVEFTSGADGDPEVIELEAVFRGYVDRLIIKQTDGDADGFTAALFSSEADADDNLDAGRIIPVQTAAAMATLTELFGNYAYAVRDAVTGMDRMKSKLWLRLDPAGTSAKPFTIAYTICLDMY